MRELHFDFKDIKEASKEIEAKFDLTVETNALLCPNPQEFYSRAYLTDDVTGNFRLLPNVKYKTKLANQSFDRALYASDCSWDDAKEAAGSLDAIDIDVCGVSALGEICQFDAEQAFFSTMMRPGANSNEIAPQMFLSQYWEELGNLIQEETALIRWQGDTSLNAATTFLAECDGYEKKLLAGYNGGSGDVVGIAGSAITKANVIAEISKVYNGLPNTLKHKTGDLRMYVSANVASAYLEAVAENNTVLYTTMNPELTYLGRIKIVVQEGMSDNTMVLTRHQNLIYAFDALGDGSDLKAVNLTDTVAEPTLRTRANLKMGFYLSNETEIVYYSTDIT